MAEDTGSGGGAQELALDLGDAGQVFLHRNPDSLSKTTGWTTWHAARIIADFLSRATADGHVRCVNMAKGSQDEVLIPSHMFFMPKAGQVGDLSSGNGFLAIVASRLGAKRVVASEVPECCQLLDANFALNGIEQPGQAETFEIYWGGPEQSPFKGCKLVLASDLLFIAIRDGLEDNFSVSHRYLLCPGHPSCLRMKSDMF